MCIVCGSNTLFVCNLFLDNLKDVKVNEDDEESQRNYVKLP